MEESVFTQQSAEEDFIMTDNLKEKSRENNVEESKNVLDDKHINENSNDILKILRSDEIMDSCVPKDKQSDSESETQDESNNHGTEFTQITNDTQHLQVQPIPLKDDVHPKVMLVGQWDPFVPDLSLLSQVKFKNDIPFLQSTLKAAQALMSGQNL